MCDPASLNDSRFSIVTEVLADAERRNTPRVDCHTVVTAVSAGTESGQRLQTVKVYSEDVSVGGARLISKDPLKGQRLLLRFLLPTFGDRYVEAEIVSETVRECRSLTGGVSKQYVYGTRFTGVVEEGAVIDALVDQSADADRSA